MLTVVSSIYRFSVTAVLKYLVIESQIRMVCALSHVVTLVFLYFYLL